MVFLHGKLHVTVYEVKHFPGKRLQRLELATCGAFRCASWALGKAKASYVGEGVTMIQYTDTSTRWSPCTLTCTLTNAHSEREMHTHRDAYVVLHLGKTYGRSVLRTSVIMSHNPVWDEVFVVPVAHDVACLTFQLKDRNVVGFEGMACRSMVYT